MKRSNQNIAILTGMLVIGICLCAYLVGGNQSPAAEPLHTASPTIVERAANRPQSTDVIEPPALVLSTPLPELAREKKEEMATVQKRPTISEQEQWLSIDRVAQGLYDGTATVDAVDTLLTHIVAMASTKEGKTGRDGIVSYTVLDTQADGQAILTRTPGRDLAPDEFELSIARKSVVGFQGPASDVTGTNLRITFGFPSGGPDEIRASSTVSIKRDSESIWPSYTSAGKVPIGGTLRVHNGSEVWSPQYLRALQKSDGRHMWEYSSGEDRRSESGGNEKGSALRELCGTLKSNH